jgi:hypothetical protein
MEQGVSIGEATVKPFKMNKGNSEIAKFKMK